ncbi:hypothetical protein H9Q74_009604 [Fusarium xylarioides]|nr:hypothetical protein H9Q71_012217 [Fusarium xylarioides]KAG5819215.1 hypothetical protein H9Q74_009604 [Fusarium xylarioides]
MSSQSTFLLVQNLATNKVVFLFGLFETGKQRESWLFDRSGVYRSGLFDDEYDLQDLLDEYGKMTELELGMNPFINQEFGGPQYICIKGDGSKMAPYDSDHSRGYKLVLDEKPLRCPDDIFSAMLTWYRAKDQFNNEFVDISLHNIFIANAGNNNPDASKGILIAFDTAMDVEIEPEKPYPLDGTKTFVAIDLSRGSDDRVLHTYRHDLESFFLYVLLFIAVGGHRSLLDESRLRLWQVGFRNWPEIAEKKRKDISSNDNFAVIIAEFRPEFKGLESLAYALRNVLFFPDRNNIFTGTNMDVEATGKLYGAMIGAFEKAVIENRE